jgi:hypothetical protein
MTPREEFSDAGTALIWSDRVKYRDALLGLLLLLKLFEDRARSGRGSLGDD